MFLSPCKIFLFVAISQTHITKKLQFKVKKTKSLLLEKDSHFIFLTNLSLYELYGLQEKSNNQ